MGAVAVIGALMLSAFGDGRIEELTECEKSQLRPLQLWARPEPFALPDMFLSETGRRITTREEWERVRRPEIRQWFETRMHGVRPVERPDDLTFTTVEPDREILGRHAVRKRVRIGYRGVFGEGGFNVTAYVPAGGRPAPAFIFIANGPRYKAFDPDLKKKTGYFPVEDIVRRGYAAVSFLPTDVAHDKKTHSLTGGVFEVFGPKKRTRTSWGSISAWAWGASRVLDWIETVPELDAKHVAVIGHSRCGKTALYATAVDERFAMACVNDSGCCGAKLNHAQVPMSENIELDNVANPHWFCWAYRDWDNRDHEVPYDQHELAALIAPRLLAIGSASDDIPSGPYGEYLTAKHCSPAWELYGKKGLAADPEVEARLGFRGFPPYDTAINAGCVSYHLRKGEHLLDSFDWKCYMDFADRHGWRSDKGER